MSKPNDSIEKKVTRIHKDTTPYIQTFRCCSRIIISFTIPCNFRLNLLRKPLHEQYYNIAYYISHMTRRLCISLLWIYSLIVVVDWMSLRWQNLENWSTKLLLVVHQTRIWSATYHEILIIEEHTHNSNRVHMHYVNNEMYGTKRINEKKE